VAHVRNSRFSPDRIGGAQYRPRFRAIRSCSAKISAAAEFFQLYRYDFATGNIILLTDGKSRNTSPRWSYQGDRIAFGSTKRTGQDVDIWVVNASDPAQRTPGCRNGRWRMERRRLVSRMANSLLVNNLHVSAAETYIWLDRCRFREKNNC
jgi:Tol biopolymer transport system component